MCFFVARFSAKHFMLAIFELYIPHLYLDCNGGHEQVHAFSKMIKQPLKDSSVQSHRLTMFR
jgi:hypothetical protein